MSERDRSDPTAAPSDHAADLPPSPTAFDWPPSAPGSPGAPLEGIHIGRYELRREIATGGMGTVYEAIQDQPRRIVALKVMRSGLLSPTAIKRFEREAQLLARLQHPNIAQVYDAGAHQLGRQSIPFIVMEHIAGALPITDYARARKLDRRSILELFVQVCDAIQHGHARGIIHRDLKPTNILVDEQGHVKVIDFGVSRTLDADPASNTMALESGQLIGTLQYMAPEQVERAGTVGTAADVYALGVVLYELLCRRLPHEVSAANLADAVRVIREQPPAPPSAIDRTLRGDLETVLTTALHKSADRRYGSVGALAEDIRRCMRGDPILARRDSVGYVLAAQMRKLIARHQVSSILAGCVLALIIAQMLAVPLVFRWTPLNRMYENVLLGRFSGTDAPALEATRLILLREGLDVEALARRHGVEGVSADDRTSLRRLHGKLMQTLATCGSRVVAIDIALPNPTDHDEAFVGGVEALADKRIDVVMIARRWSQDVPPIPQISPVIAAHVRWGSDAAGLTSPDPWRLVLFAQPPAAREPIVSFALATLAAYRQPRAQVSYVVQAAENMITLRYVGRGTQDEIRSSGGVIRSTTDREFDFPAGTMQGEFLLQIPATEVIEASSIDYDRALNATPAERRAWFEGRAVVIGDARAIGGDGPFLHPDGRRLPGCYAQAVGIDMLIREQGVIVPSTWYTAGIAVVQQWAIVLAAALAGAAGVLLAGSSAPRRVLILAGLAVACAALSLWTYAQFRYLWNPLVPIIAMGVAAFFTSRATALRQRVLA